MTTEQVFTSYKGVNNAALFEATHARQTLRHTCMDAHVRWLLQQAVEAYQRKGSMNVCDIGCGTGHYTRLVANTCPPNTRITGMDISSDMIEVAKQQQQLRHTTPDTPIVQYMTGDVLCIATEHPHLIGCMDVVLSAFCLCHFENVAVLQQAVQCMVNCLQPDGTIILLCPRYPTTPAANAVYQQYGVYYPELADATACAQMTNGQAIRVELSAKPTGHTRQDSADSTTIREIGAPLASSSTMTLYDHAWNVETYVQALEQAGVARVHVCDGKGMLHALTQTGHPQMDAIRVYMQNPTYYCIVGNMSPLEMTCRK